MGARLGTLVHRSVLIAALAGVLPGAALAQEAAPGHEREQSRPALPQTSAEPLRIERIESGFVIAPGAKFTEVNGEFATLAGVTAGWLSDQMLFIGGGAYVLANRADDLKMSYGGLVVGVQAPTDRLVGFGARALAGVGTATIGLDVIPMAARGVLVATDPFGRFGVTRNVRVQRWPPDGMSRRVPVDDTFFVAEPEVNLLLNFTERVRLNWGVGYRLVGAADGLEEQLRGATGTVSLQIGLGS